MQNRYILLAALCTMWIGIAFAREGGLGDLTDGECPPLKLQGVVRDPEEGVLQYEDVEKGIDIECKLANEDPAKKSTNADETVSDEQWKWERIACDTEDNEDPDTEILDGEVSSKLDKQSIWKLRGKVTGWHMLKCSKGENFAEFRINTGNTTKGPKLPFRVKKFEKSKIAVEKEDFTVFCDIVNRTQLRDGETIEAGIERLKGELGVRWYKWADAEDTSPVNAPKEGAPLKHNCTIESMDAKWVLMKTSEVPPGQFEPHIKMINSSGLKDQNWGFKLEDAVYDDRRAYKCVVYNISQPQNCSESAFFLRVKDKYAALWPFVGIVAEVVVLVIVIFACEHGKSKKEEFDDDGPNGNGVQQSGAAGNSNVRQRRS